MEECGSFCLFSLCNLLFFILSFSLIATLCTPPRGLRAIPFIFACQEWVCEQFNCLFESQIAQGNSSHHGVAILLLGRNDETPSTVTQATFGAVQTLLLFYCLGELIFMMLVTDSCVFLLTAVATCRFDCCLPVCGYNMSLGVCGLKCVTDNMCL